MKSKIILITLLISTIVLIGFVSSSDPFFQIRKNFTTFSEIINEVNELYVVDVDPERVIRRGIVSMLEELDPYTVLIDEADTQDIDMLTTGSYAGVGIEAGARGGELVVIAPIDGYSAQRNGVRAGDVIVSVNGIMASEMTTEDLNIQFRGEPGTKVQLVIRRTGIDEELEFELERERIEIKNISYYGFIDEEETLGYIHLTRFANNAGNDIREAIESLEEKGNLQGLVLDLRNNPGGLLNEAVTTLDNFLPENMDVVSTRGKAPGTRQTFRTENPYNFNDRPVVVLQNGGSASSSEIVAGALQDYDRAVIMGDTSFGKGLVQVIRPLSYNLSLKITTSKYFIPSGRLIQSVDYLESGINEDDPEEFQTRNGRTVYQLTGIRPDVEITNGVPSVLETALLRGNHYFFFANEFVSRNDEMPSMDDSEIIFQEFVSYLENNDFTYTTRSERSLEALITQIDSEFEDQESILSQLNDVRSGIEAEKQRDMMRSKHQIIREIYLELTTRFEGSEATTVYSLMNDDLLIRAKEVLKNQDEYQSILGHQ